MLMWVISLSAHFLGFSKYNLKLSLTGDTATVPYTTLPLKNLLHLIADLALCSVRSSPCLRSIGRELELPAPQKFGLEVILFILWIYLLFPGNDVSQGSVVSAEVLYQANLTLFSFSVEKISVAKCRAQTTVDQSRCLPPNCTSSLRENS